VAPDERHFVLGSERDVGETLEMHIKQPPVGARERKLSRQR
jgi:hypothetical protein